MRGYGVLDDLDGVLPFAWARERLVANRNYWVVTVDPSGRPHAMPVWGVWWEDVFCFSCSPDALKVRNLAANPHAVVTCADTVEVVSVEGVAEAVPAPAEVAGGWAAKYDESGDEVDASELAAFFAGGATFRVRPIMAFGLIERPEAFARRATRWVF